MNGNTVLIVLIGFLKTREDNENLEYGHMPSTSRRTLETIYTVCERNVAARKRRLRFLNSVNMYFCAFDDQLMGKYPSYGGDLKQIAKKREWIEFLQLSPRRPVVAGSSICFDKRLLKLLCK